MWFYTKLAFPNRKLTLIFVLSCNINLATAQSTRLSQEVIDDFSYNANREFNYGTGYFRSVISRGLTQKGYGIADTYIVMEQLHKNRKYQDDIFYIIHNYFGTSYDFLFSNLISMNVKAAHAKQIISYLQKKYDTDPLKTEIIYNSENLVTDSKGYVIHSSKNASTLGSSFFEVLKKYNNKYPTSSGFF